MSLEIDYTPYEEDMEEIADIFRRDRNNYSLSLYSKLREMDEKAVKREVGRLIKELYTEREIVKLAAWGTELPRDSGRDWIAGYLITRYFKGDYIGVLKEMGYKISLETDFYPYEKVIEEIINTVKNNRCCNEELFTILNNLRDKIVQDTIVMLLSDLYAEDYNALSIELIKAAILNTDSRRQKSSEERQQFLYMLYDVISSFFRGGHDEVLRVYKAHMNVDKLI